MSTSRIAPVPDGVGTRSPTSPQPISTQELIEAVFADAPTPGLPVHFARRARRPSRLGAILATAAGKTVLCASVAAASVAGVAATTDRVDLTHPAAEPVPPVVDLVPEGGPELAPVTEDEARSDTVGPESTENAPASAREVGDLPRTTELEGCEKGQAISEAASSGASAKAHERNGVDPCAKGGGGGPPESSGPASEKERGAPGDAEAPGRPATGGETDRGGGIAGGNGKGKGKEKG